MLINQNYTDTKEVVSPLAFSVSSVKISPYFSSVGNIKYFKIGHQSLDENVF